jgi:hypothetical protein
MESPHLQFTYLYDQELFRHGRYRQIPYHFAQETTWCRQSEPSHYPLGLQWSVWAPESCVLLLWRMQDRIPLRWDQTPAATPTIVGVLVGTVRHNPREHCHGGTRHQLEHQVSLQADGMKLLQVESHPAWTLPNVVAPGWMKQLVNVRHLFAPLLLVASTYLHHLPPSFLP